MATTSSIAPCFVLPGDEVPHEGDYSHVKLNVVMLKLEERHRNPETGDYLARPSKLEGDTLKMIQKLKLEAQDLHLTWPQDKST